MSELYCNYVNIIQRWRNQGCMGEGISPRIQIFANQLTLFQPCGADYVCHINTSPSRFSQLPPALSLIAKIKLTLKRIPAELNASPVLNLKNVDVFLSTPHNSGETLRQPQEISSPKIKMKIV